MPPSHLWLDLLTPARCCSDRLCFQALFCPSYCREARPRQITTCGCLRGSHTRFGRTKWCSLLERRSTRALLVCGSRRLSTISGDSQNEDNFTPTATGTAAASSTRDKWLASIGTPLLVTMACTKLHGEGQFTPGCPNTPAPPPSPDRSSTPTTPPVCLPPGIKSTVVFDADDDLAGF